MPPTSVYFVCPCSMARIAASLMRRGVSKSGSPAPNEITSIPCARMALARACMARVADGASVFRRSASMGTWPWGRARACAREKALGARELPGEALLDHRRHEPGDPRSEQRDLLDEARGDVRVAL